MKNQSKFNERKCHSSKEFFTKRRRALSTVVTAAILMSAMSVMGVMLVGWSQTSLFTKQAEIESSFNEKMNKLNEDILIENIWFSSSPFSMNITMNNVGSVGLNVTEILVVNSTDTLLFTFTGGGIAPGDTYSTNKTYVWNSGEIVDFRITTDRGNQYTTQEVT